MAATIRRQTGTLHPFWQRISSTLVPMLLDVDGDGLDDLVSPDTDATSSEMEATS